MALAVALVSAVVAGVVLAQDPTCGHCRCQVVNQDPATETPLAHASLLVNCSDDRYFPGKLRAPKLTASDEAFPIFAEFRRNGYTHIGENFYLKGAIRLSLEENKIYNVSSRAFSNFKTLRYLSLAQNRLDAIDVEMFHGLTGLEELNLSHNLLSHIPEGTFMELSSLTAISIASNHLENIGLKFFQGLDKLQRVDLSFNAIVEINPAAFSSLLLLEHLNLAGNFIVEVSGEHFANSRKLKLVDLSKNAISTLEPNILISHESLQKLVLSGNNLKSAINLPSSVTYLDLTDNHIQGVQDMWKSLDNLEELLVANTSITSLGGELSFRNVQVINMSGNSLSSFPVQRLPAVKTLDLSRNNLSAVPDGLTAAKMPSLQELFLDGNPVEKLAFPASEQPFQGLRVFSLSGDPVLQVIDREVFAAVTRKLTKLRLSRNRMLSSIHQQAFAGLELQELDLSGNSLSSLPPDLVGWARLKSVDLQHNPWDCDCSLQWILDIVVSKLYVTDQNLLYELRCASPAALRDRRMVHFYNWTQKAFCMQFEQMRMNPLDGADNSDTASLGSSTTVIIIVLSLLAALIVMVVVGVLLQRRITARRRIRNRRF